MRRFTLFLVHYCGLAAAACVMATCLALCTLDPMPRYPYTWKFGPGGPHSAFLLVGSNVMEITILSRSVTARFPVTGTLLMLTAFISLLAIGILAWRLVRLCRDEV